MPGVSSGQSLHAARDTKLSCHSPPEVSLTVPQDICDHTIVVLLGQQLTGKKIQEAKKYATPKHIIGVRRVLLQAALHLPLVPPEADLADLAPRCRRSVLAGRSSASRADHPQTSSSPHTLRSPAVAWHAISSCPRKSIPQKPNRRLWRQMPLVTLPPNQ